MTTRAPLHCRSFIGREFRPGQGASSAATRRRRARRHRRPGRRGHGRRRRGAAAGVRDLGHDHRLRARPPAARARPDRARPPRRPRHLDDARDGQAARRGARRGAQVRPGDALLRRGGRADRRRDDPQREQRVPLGRAQGARRARGRHHAVELPGRAGRLEARRRARRRLHDRPEAVGVHARRRAIARRMHPRRGLPARRRQRRPRRGRGRRPARGASGHHQDRLHGLQRHRAGALQDGDGRDPADDGARRQLPDAGLAPRRPRPRRGRRRPPLVPQRGPDLHRDQPHLRRAPRARGLRRARRGAHARAHRRRRLREPGRRRRAGDDGGDPRAHDGARRRRARARRDRRRRRRAARRRRALPEPLRRRSTRRSTRRS